MQWVKMEHIGKKKKWKWWNKKGSYPKTGQKWMAIHVKSEPMYGVMIEGRNVQYSVEAVTGRVTKVKSCYTLTKIFQKVT